MGATMTNETARSGPVAVDELADDDVALDVVGPLADHHQRRVAVVTLDVELGRIQVAARAVGVARAALEDSLRYAQQRETFGQPIWRHQAVGHRLADMATLVEAARLLTTRAAAALDTGRRSDLEAGMAKLFASEACLQVTADAIRVHGGYGYSAEFDIERYYRDAPLMVVGEGTNDIQRNVIIRQLIDRYRV